MKQVYFFLVLMLFLSLIISFVIAYDNNNNCPKCGNMDVPYPLSTAENCGNPNYRVYCNNDVLEFRSATGFNYKIQSVDTSASRLVMSPPALVTNTCLSSDLSGGGLTIDEGSPFNVSSRNTVLLLNCTERILPSPLNCSSNSPCRKFEEASEEGKGCKDVLCCSYLKDASMTSHRIRVRVGGCTAYTSIVDLKPGVISVDEWHYGIELQWIPVI